MEHQRRNDDAIVGEHPLNSQVVELVVLKVVTVAAKEAQGILFRMQMLRIVRMKVSKVSRSRVRFWTRNDRAKFQLHQFIN